MKKRLLGIASISFAIVLGLSVFSCNNGVDGRNGRVEQFAVTVADESKTYVKFQDGYEAGTKKDKGTEVRFTVELPSDKELIKVTTKTETLTAKGDVYTVTLDADKIVKVEVKAKATAPSSEDMAALNKALEEAENLIQKAETLVRDVADGSVQMSDDEKNKLNEKLEMFKEFITDTKKEIEEEGNNLTSNDVEYYKTDLHENISPFKLFLDIKDAEELIKTTVSSRNEAEVANDEKFTSQEAKVAFQTAINDAKTALDDLAEVEETDVAIKALEDAKKAFDEACKPGTVDKSKAKEVLTKAKEFYEKSMPAQFVEIGGAINTFETSSEERTAFNTLILQLSEKTAPGSLATKDELDSIVKKINDIQNDLKKNRKRGTNFNTTILYICGTEKLNGKKPYPSNPIFSSVPNTLITGMYKSGLTVNCPDGYTLESDLVDDTEVVYVDDDGKDALIKIQNLPELKNLESVRESAEVTIYIRVKKI